MILSLRKKFQNTLLDMKNNKAPWPRLNFLKLSLVNLIHSDNQDASSNVHLL